MSDCFVIAPYKEPFTDFYKSILQPAITAAGFNPKRGDEFHRLGRFMNDVWTGIVTSQVCLADLTGNNPNVLFEVGLAMAIDKPIVMISQSLNELPTDLNPDRVIAYRPEDDPEWRQRLEDEIIKWLKPLATQSVTAFRQPWKLDLTPAEKVYERWQKHGVDRSNMIDLFDPFQPTYADEFFVKRRQKESDLIEKAKSEVWLVYETGALILQDGLGALVPLLRSGGKVRLLIVSEKISEFVRYRHRFEEPDYLVKRYQTTRTYLEQIVRDTGVQLNSEQLEVRWLPFPINFVGVFIEPNAALSQRYCAIRLVGFRTFIQREPSIVMRDDLSPDTFDYYLDQFIQMWNAASVER